MVKGSTDCACRFCVIINLLTGNRMCKRSFYLMTRLVSCFQDFKAAYSTSYNSLLEVRPELFPTLLQRLQSEDVLVTQRVYMVLTQVLKELSTKRLGVDQKSFAQVYYFAHLLSTCLIGKSCENLVIAVQPLHRWRMTAAAKPLAPCLCRMSRSPLSSLITHGLTGAKTCGSSFSCFQS